MKTYTVLFLVSLLFAGCSPPPEISFVPKRAVGGLEFHIDLENINGLTRIKLWEKDTRKILWDVRMNYYRGQIVRYGDIPSNFTAFNGRRSSARQSYPVKGRPSSIPVGKDIFVYLTYQYDTRTAASGSARCYAFQVRADGAVIDLGRQPFPSEDEWPDE